MVYEDAMLRQAHLATGVAIGVDVIGVSTTHWCAHSIALQKSCHISSQNLLTSPLPVPSTA